MAEHAGKPKVRFAGFTETWEQRKLGELTNISSASRVHKGEWTESGVPFFRSSDVVSAFKGEENEKAFISYSLYEGLAKKSGKVQEGDVLITGGGSIGIPYLVKNNEPLYFKDADLLWLKQSRNLVGNFLYTFFTAPVFSAYVQSISHIGTIAHYTIEQIKDTPILFPKVDEQQKIGTFFRHLDHLITLHQRKRGRLENIKKAMLEKMFPKNGADVPEVRFAGFTEAWEQRELSYWATRYDHLRIPITASNRVSGTTPYYGANGIQDYVSGYTHDGEFILVAEDGANDLKNYPVQYVSGKIWVNNHAHVLQANTNIADNKFLKFAISQANIEPFLVGGGRSKLNAEIMMKISILAPKNIQEQARIGTFFRHLDRLITLHQRKVALLQNIKKACLEKMFV